VMGTKERIFSPLPYDVSLEDLIPKDNFYRHLEQTLDLSFVRDLVHTSPGEAGSAIGKFCLPIPWWGSPYLSVSADGR
jgi:hypothetical protein